LAAAILVFRGNAAGAAAPIRVIQGPRTRLLNPHSVNLDLKNGEILVGDLRADSVSVFPRDASGDVAPLRRICGPRSKLDHVVGLAVDPVRNLLAVANMHEIFIFNRTDNGDVPPRAVIAGPKTGMTDEPWQLQVHGGKIFVAASNHMHYWVYRTETPLPEFKEIPPDPWLNPELGFVGVWSIEDTGDRPPRAIIKGPVSGLLHPSGLALNIKEGEIMVSDSVRNGVFTYLVPDFFSMTLAPSPGTARR